MKKVIVGAAVLVLALVVLRRFGPALGRRAMAKCQELMAGHRGVMEADVSDPGVSSNDRTTPAAV